MKEAVEKFRGVITGKSGEIINEENWGLRKLAYPIRKQTEGQYVQMNATMLPAQSAEFERSVRYLEPILRYSVIVK